MLFRSVFGKTDGYDSFCIGDVFMPYFGHCTACDRQALFPVNGVSCYNFYFFNFVCSLIFHMEKRLSCPCFFPCSFSCFSLGSGAIFLERVAHFTLLSARVYFQRIFNCSSDFHCFCKLIFFGVTVSKTKKPFIPQVKTSTLLRA